MAHLFIQNPGHGPLPPEIQQVLQEMFRHFEKIVIEAEFDKGFGGSRVFRVRPIRDKPPAPLPTVVKIAHAGSIMKEWEAYQNWVANALPGVARLDNKPVLLKDNLWGGLSYTLAGDGIFNVQHMSDYCLEADTNDILNLLNRRLFRPMGQQWWFDSRANHALLMQKEYDDVLPVNLQLRLVTAPPNDDTVTKKVEPERFPRMDIGVGDTVCLSDFYVTKVDLSRHRITLNLPDQQSDQWAISYRIRVTDVANIADYHVDQAVNELYGVVEATRHSLLVTQIIKAMGDAFNLQQADLDWPTTFLSTAEPKEKSLLNPLMVYESILQTAHRVNIATIHGDLNLENILVDPETQSLRLIDFATARQGHVLHDLLRLETEFIIKLIAPILTDTNLGPQTICDFYLYLHNFTFGSNHNTTINLPHPKLEKPFSLIQTIREMARNCFYDPAQSAEYYHGLFLYLLGAMEFGSLDERPAIKRILFLAAATLATLQVLTDDETLVPEYPPDVANVPALLPPIPEVDCQLLKNLEVPGGATKQLYIRREADSQLCAHLIQPGTTTTIRAPRQSGKTSLLMQGIHFARNHRAEIVYLDFQSFGISRLTTLDDFLQALIESIGYECGLDDELIEKAWRGGLSANRKLERFMERHVLPNRTMPLILAMDEADCLMQTDYYEIFFGLLRSWHNRRSYHTLWESLNIVLVISTEPYLLIDDIHQSPFNVGLDLKLMDFDEAQVEELNQRHGSPATDDELPQMMQLLNGHPYLTRLALYEMVTKKITWPQLAEIALADNGPFSRHLGHQYWTIQDKLALREALSEIIHTHACSDNKAGLRLLRAGLVMQRGTAYACRCDLYQQYFQEKLF